MHVHDHQDILGWVLDQVFNCRWTLAQFQVHLGRAFDAALLHECEHWAGLCSCEHASRRFAFAAQLQAHLRAIAAANN